MSKTLNKYIKVLDYAENVFLVLTSADSGVSLFSFFTVISTPVEVMSASLIFLVKIVFENNREVKNKHG